MMILLLRKLSHLKGNKAIGGGCLKFVFSYDHGGKEGL